MYKVKERIWIEAMIHLIIDIGKYFLLMKSMLFIMKAIIFYIEGKGLIYGNCFKEELKTMLDKLKGDLL